MPKPIVVLGLHEGHDSGVALVRDGQVLAAIQEERMRGIKHYSDRPEQALGLIFETAKINPSDVDAIAISGLVKAYGPVNERPTKLRLIDNGLVSFVGRRLAPSSFVVKNWLKVMHRFREMRYLRELFAKTDLGQKEIHFVEHHLCHAASAYRLAPWDYSEPLLVLTLDGAGDGLCATISKAEGGDVDRVEEVLYYHSPSNVVYSEITRYLGMNPWDHEYKVMGLAPYGNANRCIEKVQALVGIDKDNPLRFRNNSGVYGEAIQPKLRNMLARQRFDNVAAAVQLWFEELVAKWVQNAILATGIHKIACAGGSFLNVKANKKLVELQTVDDAFFYPAAGDDGLAVGAALQIYYELARKDGRSPRKSPLLDLYYGPEYNDERIRKSLKDRGHLERTEFVSDVDSVVGEYLARGKIVARFNGRMEWGPRALGNRSILADPRNPRIVNKINSAIKLRDFWMPFAPTMLSKMKDLYLLRPREAPYMILAFDTTLHCEEILAAIHPFDRTCRPQTLNESNNPGYFKVLQSFHDLTGVGAVLNTSFNLHGYPIVCSPEQALWTFERSNLDCLVLGNYVLQRK